MAHKDAHDPEILKHYEGLIFSTTRLYYAAIDMEFEDIQQILRIKVFRALLAFDEKRAKGLTRDRFVFSCLRNQVKDLIKRKRRHECFIEDMNPRFITDNELTDVYTDWFHNRFLSTSHEEVYGHVEAEPLSIPSTLTEKERGVVILLATGVRQLDVQKIIGITRSEFEAIIEKVRVKMADWAPSRPTKPPRALPTNEPLPPNRYPTLASCGSYALAQTAVTLP